MKNKTVSDKISTRYERTLRQINHNLLLHNIDTSNISSIHYRNAKNIKKSKKKHEEKKTTKKTSKN